MKLLTVAGWDTTSDMVNPRKPVAGAWDARTRTLLPASKAAV